MKRKVVILPCVVSSAQQRLHATAHLCEKIRHAYEIIIQNDFLYIEYLKNTRVAHSYYLGVFVKKTNIMNLLF